MPGYYRPGAAAHYDLVPDGGRLFWLCFHSAPDVATAEGMPLRSEECASIPGPGSAITAAPERQQLLTAPPEPPTLYRLDSHNHSGGGDSGRAAWRVLLVLLLSLKLLCLALRLPAGSQAPDRAPGTRTREAGATAHRTGRAGRVCAVEPGAQWRGGVQFGVRGMKLLESSSFEALSSRLCVETGDARIIGRPATVPPAPPGMSRLRFSQRVCFSVPSAWSLFRPVSRVCLCVDRVPRLSRSEEGDGPLSDTCCRKTLFYLIATLNEAFRPDYDFSTARAHAFSREPSLAWVVTAVDGSLFSAVGEEFNSLGPELWSAIDQEIHLQGCNIYSYNPDLDSDPYGEEGSLWSFNYLFYNKKLKRIVFFTCRSVSVLSGYGLDSLDEDLDMELDDEQYEEEKDSFTEDRFPRAVCV
ncbi:MAF1 homolog, negative regulator of RNA polymerase III b [Amia ocellicauda]|uniref:MAF1 homolog, negative regulator of RNA polymerase III b n=1 Tax=Amia ocellicauda TaxID=2972642 RepID=UPI003464927B